MLAKPKSRSGTVPNMTRAQHLAATLRRLRDEYHHTFETAIAFTGVTARHYARLAAGQVKDPRQHTLELIATAYGITIDELVGGTPAALTLERKIDALAQHLGLSFGDHNPQG